MPSTKNATMALLAVLVAAVIVYAAWAVTTRPSNTSEGQSGAVCTLDAMQCPDGSWVGRSGPNCQFVCPVGTSTAPSDDTVFLQAAIDHEAYGLGVKIIPIAVLEDSRCPNGVQCIQAGTVRVRAQLVSGLGSADQIFALGTPITTEAEIVTLVAVSPETEAGKAIRPGDYRFTFKVIKR